MSWWMKQTEVLEDKSFTRSSNNLQLDHTEVFRGFMGLWLVKIYKLHPEIKQNEVNKLHKVHSDLPICQLWNCDALKGIRKKRSKVSEYFFFPKQSASL